MSNISGGYYIKARKIQESVIAFAPPHVREIWDWLLKECNHKDNKVCKRGQCVRTYNDMRDGLKWTIGYRVMRYKKHHCEKSMKYLTKHGMIAKMKTTRGLLITVLNYDRYQNPQNYESHNGDYTKATRKLQGVATINKNGKNVRKNKEIYATTKTVVAEVFNYHTLKTKKRFTLNTKNTDIIKKRLLEGKTVDELKVAIDNFVADDWEGRKDNLDLIYCLGYQKGKPDTFDKWYNKTSKTKKDML